MTDSQLKRETFTTSRLMDFFSVKELTTQIGHPVNEWPLVCVKELIDNSLDACEDAGIQPDIDVVVNDHSITVYDNGLGIPSDTIANMLDFHVRVSSREAYISPDRGAQGNALKTLIAMPFVLDGETGKVDIYTQGLHHSIVCKVDHIRQLPVIEHDIEPCDVKNGACFVINWTPRASLQIDVDDHFLQIAESFTFLNPHLTLRLDLFGKKSEWLATDTEWTSWKPSNPTSPHWYTDETLSRLISAYLALDTEMTVRDFISEFRGLAGSAKQKKVLNDTGLTRLPLHDLVNDGMLDDDKISSLLASMKEHTKPVQAKLLGIIGEEHIRTRFEELGCEMKTFSYSKKVGMDDGLPWIVEMAFAWRGDESSHRRKLVSGVNWSAGIDNPFRKLGKFGQSMDTVLTEARAGANEPVIMLMHMSCPRVIYSDRGKSAIVLED